MKKFSIMILTLLLTAAMCVPVFADAAGQETRKDSAQVYGQNVFSNVLTVTSKTMKVKRTKGLSVSVKYPRIRGMEDKQAQKSMNAALLKEARAALAQGRKTVTGLKKTGNVKSQTRVSFDVKYNESGILSIIMKEYQFARGANGTNTYVCMNFDLSTGKEIAAAELFTDFDQAKAAINKAVRSGIDAAEKETEKEVQPFETIADDQEFWIGDKGLTIVFQQDGPYFTHAAGVQEFTVPYEDLAACLKTDYAHLLQPKAQVGAGAMTQLAAGQLAYLVLDSNPTTGYTWTVKLTDDKIVNVIKQQYLADPEGKDLAGSGGKEVIIVKAVSKGTVKLQCTYGRDWSAGTQGKTIEADIIVR